VFIFDTDTITHHQREHAALSARVSSTPAAQLFTTSVTVAEQLQGRLSYLNTHRNNPRQLAQGHSALVRTVSYFNQCNILLFKEYS
jgi:predicted nucleic acid-binding protein